MTNMHSVKLIPRKVLFGNPEKTSEENPQVHDAYHLDLASSELTLVAEDPGNVSAWVTDNHFNILGIISRDNADANWVIAFTVDDGLVAFYAYHRTTRPVTFLFYAAAEKFLAKHLGGRFEVENHA
jgi:hypothetical protein